MPRPALFRAALCVASTLASAPLAAQNPSAAATQLPGAARHTLAIDSGRRGAAGDLSDLLTGRIPGLVVQQRSGALGAGADIRLRGRSTILLATGPAIYVDGVRVDSRAVSSSLLESYAAPSALDEIAPDDIERIEVLPGPAAAWGYGGGAASGVLLVTTRRPERGRIRWRAHTEQGAAYDAAAYPANVSGWWTTTAGNPSPSCVLHRQAAGECSLDSLVSFNPLEQAGPFRTAHQSRVGVSATGGTPFGGLRLAVGHESEDGVLETATRDALRASAAIASSPLPTLGLDARVAYARSTLRSPETSEFMTVLEGGLLGSASDEPELHGFREPLESILGVRPRRDADRLMAGASADWRPLSWLRAGAIAGIERSDVSEALRHTLVEEGWPDPIQLYRYADGRQTSYTFTASATASWTPASSLRAATTFGASDHRIQARRTNIEEDVSGDLFSSTTWWRQGDVSTLALTLHQRLDWRDRVAVSLGIRAENPDRAVTFGNASRDLLPAASIAWELGKEEFFPRTRLAESVRLRAAWAEVTRPHGGLVELSWEYLGFPGVEDERTRELEAGIDLESRDGRVGASLTLYRQRTGNALVLVPIASPSGFYTAPRNVGLVRSQGATGQLALALLRGTRWSWDATLQGAVNSNELTGISGVPPFFASIGESVDARLEHPVVGATDANGDGVIAPEEVVFGTLRYRGSSFPRREGALWSRLALAGRGSLSVLLDYRGGFEQANRTGAVRCRIALCAAAYDPSLSTEEQIRLASIMSPSGLSSYLNENGRFLRLREVALSLVVPERWAAGLGASSAQLTIAGRNLALWSPYSGLDPEIRAATSVGGADPTGASDGDFFAPPLTRQLTARLELAW